MTSSFAQMIEEEAAHAAKTTDTWKKISLFVAVPGLILTTYNSVQKETEHHHHVQEHGRDPFVPYPHLRLRNKPWPWGDGNHSLVHNPKTNPLPEGYEDE